MFEAQLELRDPDLVFIPSLNTDDPDCFSSVVEGLISDIIKMASLIPRIAINYGAANYEVSDTYKFISVVSNIVPLNNEIFLLNSVASSINIYICKIYDF